MNGQQDRARLEASAHDTRTSQMCNLRYFLDVFASADPVMRAGADCYCERLREEGCDGEEVIKIAATALLVALEQEIARRESILTKLPAAWTDVFQGR